MIKIAALLSLGLVALSSADATPPRPPAPLADATPAVSPAATAAAVADDLAARTVALRGSDVPSDWPPFVAPISAVPFVAGSMELRDAAQTTLDGLASRLAKRPDLVVELRGFATDIDDDASRARRLALARTLIVRARLIADGVAKTRITVRPLGTGAASQTSPDRVDLVALTR